MILVLSSDGVCEFCLVRDVIGVPVHIDWFVPVAQVVWPTVLGEMFF